MGLLVLVAAGGLLGWLATIVMRIEDRQGVLLNLAAGVAGGLIAVMVINPGAVIGALSVMSLLAGAGGSLAALALANFVRNAVTR